MNEQAWFPLWVNKWLLGSTRFELTLEERAVWIDFLALATMQNGYIRANPTLAYPKPQLAGFLNIPQDILERSIEKFIKTGKLIEDPINSGIFYICNWEKYKLSDDYKKRIFKSGVGYWRKSRKRKSIPKNSEGIPKNSECIPKNSECIPKNSECIPKVVDNFLEVCENIEKSNVEIFESILNKPESISNKPESVTNKEEKRKEETKRKESNKEKKNKEEKNREETPPHISSLLKSNINHVSNNNYVVNNKYQSINKEEKKKEEKEERKKEEKAELSRNKRAYPVDEEFILQLKQNPAYKHIDIDREIAKIKAWLLTPKGRGKFLTRGRLVNWLNKIDVPLNIADRKESNPEEYEIVNPIKKYPPKTGTG